jgi:hypothetical protein
MYQGVRMSPKDAAWALHKFSFAKLVEEPGPKFVVRVHDRCWFELEHSEERPCAAPTMKIRKSYTGKLHLSGGPSAAHCSAGNRGMQFVGRAPANAVHSFPKDSFCKKCFGNNPYGIVAHLIKEGYLE